MADTTTASNRSEDMGDWMIWEISHPDLSNILKYSRMKIAFSGFSSVAGLFWKSRQSALIKAREQEVLIYELRFGIYDLQITKD